MADEKRPGRPRQYADAAERAAMFRSRQVDAGYLRREVLMTPESIEAAKALAKAERVSFLDVTSGLLEYGLSQYMASASGVTAAPVIGGAAASQLTAQAYGYTAASAAIPSQTSLVTSPDADNNPITRFFRQRKELKNDQ